MKSTYCYPADAVLADSWRRHAEPRMSTALEGPPEYIVVGNGLERVAAFGEGQTRGEGAHDRGGL